MKKRVYKKIIIILFIILVIIGTIMFFTWRFFYYYGTREIRNLTSEEIMMIAEDFGIKVPEGSKVKDCYLRQGSYWLSIKFYNIHDIGTVLNKYFLEEDMQLSQNEISLLKRWLENPGQSDAGNMKYSGFLRILSYGVPTEYANVEGFYYELMPKYANTSNLSKIYICLVQEGNTYSIIVQKKGVSQQVKDLFELKLSNLFRFRLS